MNEAPIPSEYTRDTAPTMYVIDEGLRPLQNILVFTGHAPDSPTRLEPRFPVASTIIARESIDQALAALPFTPDAVVMGGTPGADLLAAVNAMARGIPVRLILPFDRQSFRETVITGPPSDNLWLTLWDTLTSLSTTEIVEPVLRKNPHEKATAANIDTSDSTIYEQVNEVMVSMLQGVPGKKGVIAYWNGKGGDKPGGTEDAVRKAKNAGAEVVIVQNGLENVDSSKMLQYITA